MGLGGFAGQEDEEVVIAIEELAQLQQVASKEADDRTVGSRAQSLRAFDQPLQSFRTVGERAWRRTDCCPHALRHGLGDRGRTTFLHEWVV